LVTEDSDKMFYKMEEKVEDKSLSEMLQEGFNKEQNDD
jgi:cytidine deaminase